MKRPRPPPLSDLRSLHPAPQHPPVMADHIISIDQTFTLFRHPHHQLDPLLQLRLTTLHNLRRKCRAPLPQPPRISLLSVRLFRSRLALIDLRGTHDTTTLFSTCPPPNCALPFGGGAEGGGGWVTIPLFASKPTLSANSSARMSKTAHLSKSGVFWRFFITTPPP